MRNTARNNAILNKKQLRFAEEYLKDFNGTQAVIRAGYAVKNPNVAHTIAGRLLRKGAVKEFIQARQQQISYENNITVDYFVRKIQENLATPGIKPNEITNALNLLAKITGNIRPKPADDLPLVIINQHGLIDS